MFTTSVWLSIYGWQVEENKSLVLTNQKKKNLSKVAKKCNISIRHIAPLKTI